MSKVENKVIEVQSDKVLSEKINEVGWSKEKISKMYHVSQSQRVILRHKRGLSICKADRGILDAYYNGC